MLGTESQFLDHYCERLDAGYWGEPFNLVSNLAFIIAGFLISRHLIQQRNNIDGKYWDLVLLVALLFAIGIGSSLWHLVAKQWALKADIIPIILFINIYLLSCLFRLFSLSIVMAISVFAFYHIVNFSIQSSLPVDYLNGSVFYLPGWIFLLGIAIFAWKLKLRHANSYLLALLVFSISLVFRTVDLALCGTISIGTHFIWHLLNAVTLYILLVGLINHSVSYKSQSLS